MFDRRSGLQTLGIGLLLLAAGWSHAQDRAIPEKVSVAFSDPARPGLLKVSLIGGSITVKGYNGREVVIEAEARPSRRRSDTTDSQGLRRIQIASTGLTVEEENNVMSVSVSPSRSVDLTIQVPTRTSLRLRSVNSGEIVVEQVEGEIDVNNTNGGVRLSDVSGSVVAHALNGPVVAVLRRVDSQKPMSFTSMNGKIDVTLPASIKTNVKMRSDHGDIFSDFDIALRSPSADPVVVDNRSRGGRYQIRFDRSMIGSINGGGPELELRSFNGSIHVRKGNP